MTIQLRQCIRAAQRGDKLAAEEVIRAFKPFLNKQAKQYQKQYRRHYHNFYEALSTAYQGAMHCILHYDLEQTATVAEVMAASVRNYFRRESYGHQCYCDRVEKNVFENDGVTDLPETALASEGDCPEYRYFQNELGQDLTLALENCRNFSVNWSYIIVWMVILIDNWAKNTASAKRMSDTTSTADWRS